MSSNHFAHNSGILTKTTPNTNKRDQSGINFSKSNDVNNGIGEADEIGNGSVLTTHRRPSEVAYES